MHLLLFIKKSGDNDKEEAKVLLVVKMIIITREGQVCALLMKRKAFHNLFCAYRNNGIQLGHRQLLGALHRRRNLLLVLQ